MLSKKVSLLHHINIKQGNCNLMRNYQDLKIEILVVPVQYDEGIAYVLLKDLLLITFLDTTAMTFEAASEELGFLLSPETINLTVATLMISINGNVRVTGVQREA